MRREGLTRRALLGVVAAGAAVWAGLRARVARAAGLRPPGALPAGKFEAACIRCFRCAEVCPVQCIRFEATGGPWQWDTPVIHAAERACILCMRCTEACPTGALQLLRDERDNLQKVVHMGVPVLDKNACLPWNRQGICRACYVVCPYPDSAITLQAPSLGPLFHPDACVGCGLCEEACPAHAHAIRIVPPDTKAPAA